MIPHKPHYSGLRLMAAALAILTLSVVGCGGMGNAGRTSVREWQSDVERYMAVHARRDPNLLRDATVVNGHRVFASLGGKDPERSTDVVGVILGTAQEAGASAMVFLLATVEGGRVTEIRGATLSVSENTFDWRLGPETPEALRKYRQTHPAMGHHPAWPTSRDVFRYEAVGSGIMITEETSGAVWRVPPPQRVD